MWHTRYTTAIACFRHTVSVEVLSRAFSSFAFFRLTHACSNPLPYQAMTIAADTCVYTNHNFVIETIPAEGEKKVEGKEAASA